jgi:predicted transcriptional regulator YdeE
MNWNTLQIPERHKEEQVHEQKYLTGTTKQKEEQHMNRNALLVPEWHKEGQVHTDTVEHYASPDTESLNNKVYIWTF